MACNLERSVPRSSACTRSRISAAALSVYVSARISPGWAWCSRMRCAMRRISTVVLPVPAPATTSRGPWTCSIASRWRSSGIIEAGRAVALLAIGSSIADPVVDVMCESSQDRLRNRQGGDGGGFGAKDGRTQRGGNPACGGEGGDFVVGPAAFGANRERNRLAGRMEGEGIGQADLLLVLGKENAHLGWGLDRVFDLDGGGDFRRQRAARLLSCLASQALPSLGALRSRRSQMRVGAPGNDWHDSGDPQFGALLDGPLHTIELEDRQQESHFGERRSRDVLSEFELDAGVADRKDPPAAHSARNGDVEFLPDSRPQHLGQVLRMCPGKGGAILMNVVGDPASAGHFFSTWYPVPGT